MKDYLDNIRKDIDSGELSFVEIASKYDIPISWVIELIKEI